MSARDFNSCICAYVFIVLYPVAVVPENLIWWRMPLFVNGSIPAICTSVPYEFEFQLTEDEIEVLDSAMKSLLRSVQTRSPCLQNHYRTTYRTHILHSPLASAIDHTNQTTWVIVIVNVWATPILNRLHRRRGRLNNESTLRAAINKWSQQQAKWQKQAKLESRLRAWKQVLKRIFPLLWIWRAISRFMSSRSACYSHPWSPE